MHRVIRRLVTTIIAQIVSGVVALQPPQNFSWLMCGLHVIDEAHHHTPGESPASNVHHIFPPVCAFARSPLPPECRYSPFATLRRAIDIPSSLFSSVHSWAWVLPVLSYLAVETVPLGLVSRHMPRVTVEMAYVFAPAIVVEKKAREEGGRWCDGINIRERSYLLSPATTC